VGEGGDVGGGCGLREEVAEGNGLGTKGGGGGNESGEGAGGDVRDGSCAAGGEEGFGFRFLGDFWGFDGGGRIGRTGAAERHDGGGYEIWVGVTMAGLAGGYEVGSKGFG